MVEGEIIKFYRKKAGLTQEELGLGICTLSYISKIERGQSACSSEIIELLSERLHLDIKKEIRRFENLGNQLYHWHKTIIMRRLKEVDEINKELEKIPFINSSKYAALYQLLQARYYILKMNYKKTYTLLQYVEKEHPNLPPYEKNLLKHVWGIYYICNCISSRTENHQKAIEVLKEIEKDEYGNPEYNYDLAVAYHCIDSRVMAYAYAEKALRYFRETNNSLMAITAESLMLLQIGNDIHHNLEELTESYYNLIHHSELLYATDKKGMLLNNLGFEHFRRKDYAHAHKFYKEALQMTDKSSVLYLQRLYNYLESGLAGKIMRKSSMLRKAQEGMSLAKKLENEFYQLVFKLLILLTENKLNQYYTFIEKDALPYFQLNNHTIFINKYAKELYDHYMESEHYQKAAQISKVLIDPISAS
ncbi:helix-turn-helix domain-containing protein [Rossellomorea sp. BNER]|uniref:helix-turn-helix domain-containing protein n=1 Tax=Rossellomorea sp. BNER TaxID=2962031 RepID=UPI003AF257B4|nr:helix-turn-helix transcriptional regulator [Rossellomorea sp. BNER]